VSEAAAPRWNFRVAPDVDDVVRRAASTSNRTLTDFVLEAAVNEAERILAERTRFALEPEAWSQFAKLLDRAVQERPGLVRLFAKPSAFE
jgi:uncharacterized protein (DUF1778 family)